MRKLRLLEYLGEDLWKIVLDLLTYYHQCCFHCQPFDGGEPFGLSKQEDLLESLQELVISVCKANKLRGPSGLDRDMVAQAFDDSPTHCPNCGCEWDSSTEIGGEWLVDSGRDTDGANYLLTKTYWSYLTHYTKESSIMSGLEVLSKIVSDRRIIASDRLIVGKRKVVCFTECSPFEINELLEAENVSDKADTFKWKRSRHGIAIDRQALCEYGALPVLHGDIKFKESLPPELLFRFQKFDRKIGFSDWTFEREFRVEGDVNLTGIDPYKIIIIVANRAEKLQLLARRKPIPFPIMPFDYVFSKDAPYPSMTERQREAAARLAM